MLQSMGSQRVGHKLLTEVKKHTILKTFEDVNEIFFNQYFKN